MVGRLGGPVTVFVDAINLTNRLNVGLGDAVLDRATGEVSGATTRLYSRLVTAGIRVAF